MRVHGYNKERKESFLDVYMKALIFGGIAAFVLIAGGLGIKFFIEMAIKYWVWTLISIAGLIFLAKFLNKGRKR